MNPADFTAAKPGHFVDTVQGAKAFVPAPLPPEIAWPASLVRAHGDAERALGELGGVGRFWENPHVLIWPFLRREAVLSSKIEGTQTTLAELMLFETEPKASREGGDVREVMNYVNALEYALKQRGGTPLSLFAIRELHKILMTDVRGDSERLTPGSFRTDQVMIGGERGRIETARFVPPPRLEMEQALVDFEKFLGASSDLPKLARIALVHYQFETIHPFFDGNGRLGRLLITLLLCREGLLPEPLLYLSAFFDANRDEYYQRLLRVSQAGEWGEWLDFFFRGVSEQSRDAIDRTKRLLDLREEYREKCTKAKASVNVLAILDDLFRSPYTTIPQAQRLVGVTYRSASLNIEKLTELGVLKEITGKLTNKVYLAEKILHVLS